jgi:hypothetical protein
VRIALLSLALATAGCAAVSTEDPPRGTLALGPADARIAMGDVFGPHAAAVQEALEASGAEAPDAEAEARFVVWVDELIVQQDPLDLLAGFTLTTIPAVRWHQLRLTGKLVARDGAVLAEAEARSEACVLFGWPLLLAFPLWSDGAGSDVIDEQVRGLTRSVLASLLSSDRP